MLRHESNPENLPPPFDIDTKIAIAKREKKDWNKIQGKIERNRIQGKIYWNKTRGKIDWNKIQGKKFH